MPKVEVNGVQVAYKDRGRGLPIVFGHSLTLDSSMYDEAVERLSQSFRTIQVDFRCHGDSERLERDFTLWDVAEDICALTQHLGLSSIFYVGLSMGGMVGMRLAVKHPSLIKGMVLLDTSAEEEEQRVMFEQWAERVKDEEPNEQGALAVLRLMLMPRFFEDHPAIVSKLVTRLMTHSPQAVYRATLAVLHRDNIVPKLGDLRIPTLVIVGDHDIATPPKHADAIHGALRGSELFVVPEAGHLTILEKPDLVIPKIESFARQVMS